MALTQPQGPYVRKDPDDAGSGCHECVCRGRQRPPSPIAPVPAKDERVNAWLCRSEHPNISCRNGGDAVKVVPASNGQVGHLSPSLPVKMLYQWNILGSALPADRPGFARRN